MSNIKIMIDAIFPLCVYTIIGVIVYKKFNFGKAQLSALSKIIFNVLMPCIVFRTSYKAHMEFGTLAKLCIVYIVITIIWIVITVFIGKKVCVSNETAAAFAASEWKVNYSLIGLPIAANMMSDEGYSCFAALLVVSTIMLNMLIVIITTLVVNSNKGVDYKKLFIKVLTNPVIIGTVLGLVVKLIPGGLPELIYMPIDGFASATTPISLFYIGCSIAIGHDVKNTKPMVVLMILKFIISPLFACGLSMLFGLSGASLGAMCLSYALPVASNCGILVEGSGGDGQFANEACFISMVFSVFTLFITGIILLNLNWV